MKNIETERRFFIEYPDIAALSATDGAEVRAISQTYLRSADGTASRVRRTEVNGRVEYRRTDKRRISGMSSYEDERVITEEEYNGMLREADPDCRTVEKTRIAVPYSGLIYEIDVFPFFTDRAIMEAELTSEASPMPLPPFVSVIREITGDRRYSNHSLAKSVPTEDAYLGVTERLCDIDPMCASFSSRIVSSEECSDGYQTVLASSAFFPGGGGQDCDLGKINGIPVSSVYEKDGVIFHITAEKLPAGAVAVGELDFSLRFRRMQNHTAEHMISGLAHRVYGADNVGFHMGRDGVTLDLNIFLGNGEIKNIELLANQAVWENRAVNAFYPSAEVLARTDYRSKKELRGKVRLVDIDGVDICACCAPHVRSTGEIGIIKITDSVKYKSGVRITVLAGGDALDAINRKCDVLSAISRELSAKPDGAHDAFLQYCRERDSIKFENIGLKRRLAEMLADSCTDSAAVFFEDGFDCDAMRYLAKQAVTEGAVVASVFSANPGGYSFVTVSEGHGIDLSVAAEKLRAGGLAKCGGSATMISGSITSSADRIRAFFSELGNFK